MSFKKKIFMFSFMMIFVMMATTLTVSSQTIRLSHGMSPDTSSPTHAYAVAFKDYVEANTDISIDIYSDNVLGGQQEVMEQTAEGDIHVTQVSIGGLSHYSDKALIYNFPYAYPEDNRVAYELWQRGNEFTNNLFDEFEEESGVRPVHVFPRGGGMALTNSVRPVTSLDDMEGIQFRAMDQMQIELYRSLGADGVSVPWEELYTALQTGVADGQLNPPYMFLQQSFDEVQDYMTLPGVSPGNGVWIVNPDWYHGLSEEDRAVIDVAFERAFTVAEGISYLQQALSVSEVESAGVEVSYQTEEEYNAFREAALDGMMDWAYEKWGEEFVDSFMEEIEKIESKY